MDFNMQQQMPGAFPDADRDEFGFTPADYDRLLNEVDINCFDGNYEVVPIPHQNPSSNTVEPGSYAGGQMQLDNGTEQFGMGTYDEGNMGSQGGAGFQQYGDYQQFVPPIESSNHARGQIQPNSGTNQPGTNNYNDQHGYYQQSAPLDRLATVQPDSHTEQPGVSTLDSGNLNGQGGTTYHQDGGYQPNIPPNPFAIFGNRYPAPPVGWEDSSNDPSEQAFLDSLPSSCGGRTGTARNTPSAQYGSSYGTSRRAATRFDASSPYLASQHPPSQYQPSQNPTSQYQPAQHRPAQHQHQPTQHRPAQHQHQPAQHRPSQQQNEPRLQTQPSRRQPAILVVDDEDDDEDKPVKAAKKKRTTKGPQMGITRLNEEGELEWFPKAGREGVLAVRHDDIRPQLIAVAEAARMALGVQYAHPDKPGPGSYNVTSFYSKHVNWGPKREDRPENLFAWEEDKRKNPRPECPGDMYWEDSGKEYIVLDPHDNPVKDWDIPLTIASNIPGYKLEAMRRDNMSLKHNDFWARMPRRINFGTPEVPIWQELGETNSVVNMPIERFRFRAGLCSWTRRTGTIKIKEGLKRLYGDKIQNNSVKAFGRDLTTREIQETKKGKEARFPIVDKVRTRKGTNNRKRKGPVIMLSDEDSQTPIRPRKRARHDREEATMASEIDDLDMQMPAINHGDAGQRYPLRSTRKDQKGYRTVEPVEELGDQSSTGEDYHSESDKVGSVSQESFVETDDDEERTSPRVPFRRIPGAADVGGKCKGPSWVSSTRKDDEGNEERDHRKAVIPLNIDGRVHYATYEGLISNGPLQCDGASDAVLQRQGRDIADVSLQQNESEPPRPHPFEVAMNAPVFGLENPEEEDTPLQAHRKRVREYLGEEEPEAQAPPSKRQRTEQQVLPPSGPATHEATVSVPAQTASPAIIQPQIYQNRRAPPSPQAQASRMRKQKLDAEWAQVFEQTFLDLGFQSVNYSEVSPWNDEEVQSLIDALLPTREVYLAWTGEPAPRTDPHQSYRAQFDAIFLAFQDWWETHRPNEDLPILSGVVHGGRSIDDWIPPSRDSIYYEAFERGYQAQRGGLSNCSGPSLEDALRIPY